MNMFSIKKSLLALFFVGLLFSCKKKDPEYVYEVNTEQVTKTGTNKTNLKTNLEFISICYSDLFGTTITNDKLIILSTAYESFGDKKLMGDIIVRNFLNTPGVQIPTKQTMRNDVNAFITNSYKKFYNRNPSEMELWSIKNIVNSDTTITPELLYYSFLTSNEYRFY